MEDENGGCWSNEGRNSKYLRKNQLETLNGRNTLGEFDLMNKYE
jgi:hypothetical protein